MARTPLFGMLARIARDHRDARALGVDVASIEAKRAEARREREKAGLSRRAFLGGASAVGASLLLPKSAHAAANPRVVIVGGGISGLAAMLSLADAKLTSSLVLYEASNRIGGRMFSNAPGIGGMPYWDDDQVTEWCGELIDTDHTTVQDLATRYGLTLDDLPTSASAMSGPVHLFGGKYYTLDQINADFAPVWTALSDDYGAAILANKNDGSPNDDGTVLYDAIDVHGIALDQMSVYDWIEQKVPGGHGSNLGKLLDLAYASEYGADTKDQSSLNLVLLLGGLADPNAFEPFGASDERFHIRGGNQLLPLAIADDLTKRLGASAIQMNSKLTKIAKNKDGTVALSFDVLSAGVTKSVAVEADAVILTLPFAILADKVDFTGAGFDARKTQAIKELGRGLCTKLQLQFQKRLWAQSGAWGVDSGVESFSDNGNQCSWEPTRGQPGTSGILNGYTGGQPTLDRATVAPVSFGKVDVGSMGAAIGTLATSFLGQLEQLFPGITALYNGKATLSIPHLDDNFALSYSYWKVGQYGAFAGYERAPQGNIFFAGEHTSVNYQGFMEGGASEGVRAAQEVADAAASGALPSKAPTPAAEASGCTTSAQPVETSGSAPLAAAAIGVGLLARRAK